VREERKKRERKRERWGDNLSREKKAQRAHTRMLKGPDAACESLRGRVDVPDWARAPA